MGIVKKSVETIGKGVGKVAGAIDITCDNCGKLMKPGMFGTKRKVKGKDYQFCSKECADEYEAEHK